MMHSADRRTSSVTRDDCLALDRADPLAHARARFVLPDGVNYLDGNSLGARPKGVAERVAHTIEAGMGHRPDPLVERGRLVRGAGTHRRETRAAARRRAASGHRHRHDLGQPVQAARRRRAHAAGSQDHPRRARQFSLRQPHRRERRAHDGAERRASCRPSEIAAAIDDGHRRGRAVPRQLSHRRDPGHGGDHGGRACQGRADRLGPRAFERRGRTAARSRPRRFRGRLRLQVPQRRARRAVACLCGGAAPRGARSAAHRLVRACGAVCVRRRLRARRRHPRDAVLDAADALDGRRSRPRSMPSTAFAMARRATQGPRARRPDDRACRRAPRAARRRHRLAARRRAARQPCLAHAPGRLSHHAGADRARRDRRFPQPRRDALRLRAALCALRRYFRCGRGAGGHSENRSVEDGSGAEGRSCHVRPGLRLPPSGLRMPATIQGDSP